MSSCTDSPRAAAREHGQDRQTPVLQTFNAWSALGSVPHGVDSGRVDRHDGLDHGWLVAAKNVMSVPIGRGHLFTFLDPEPTMEGALPIRTTRTRVMSTSDCGTC